MWLPLIQFLLSGLLHGVANSEAFLAGDFLVRPRRETLYLVGDLYWPGTFCR